MSSRLMKSAVCTRTVMTIEVPYFQSPDFSATPEYDRARPRRSRAWWSFRRSSGKRRSPLKFSPCALHLQSSFNPAKVRVISLPDCCSGVQNESPWDRSKR